MSEFFMPYEGKKPFVFVSYSHLDSGRVLDIIFPLHEQKYRVWYDEGIPAGCDWPGNIASHMRDTAAVLFFISAFSLASDNCLNEIKEALRQQKPVLSVELDHTEIPAEWVPLLEQTTLLEQKDRSGRSLDRAILEHGMIGPAFLGDGKSDPKEPVSGLQINIWMLVAIISMLLLIATTVGTYGLANNWFDAYLMQQPAPTMVVIPTPPPTATPTAEPIIVLEGPWVSMLSEYAAFPDDLEEDAVRAALDQPDGDVLQSDLLKITQLHFCGNMVLQNDAGIAFDRDGNCSVNSAPVIRGSINDLSLLSDLLTLERLSLVYQNIKSLDPLATLVRLTELNAAGNPIESIGDLSGMLSLQTLRLEHTSIQDLFSLNGLPQLKTVTVSEDMFPLHMNAATQEFDVVLVH